MGRRPGDPHDQAAMGHPGKRKSKTEKAIAEAERLATLLVAAHEDASSPPAFLQDKRMAHALAVWNDHAPRLDKLHILSPLDRVTFALFCVYAGEFVLANEEILTKGYSILVKTVSGDRMPRENPAVGRRDYAAKMLESLSGRFGLTPADRNRLLRDSAMRFDAETLFGREAAASADDGAAVEAAPAPAVPAAPDGSAIGSLASLDSMPPGVKPN